MLIVNAKSNKIKLGRQYMAFDFNPKKKKETTNKTIRFPKDLAERIDRIAAFKDSYFSTFVVDVCKQAVEEIEFKYGVNTNNNTDEK